MAKLNEKQYAAIAILSLPNKGGMTYEEIAEEVGVDVSSLRRWRNDDTFNNELKRTVMRNTLERLPDVMASVPDHIINDGNAAMFRTFLQAHDLLTERQEVTTKDNGAADVNDMKAQIEAFKAKQKAEEQ
ncbi:phBC6A51 family helix-turn-helix protein [Terribacillus sp. 179-K 1B1 HS]|uniref:phBC6A51 family helix-turn-helix protein n=1 Tax=Terribacillus sp. 179-K 1B1 HS TaxID=3142388 RepID=UPI00399FC9B5